MTAKDLKNALLQEAVQGKLVPQIASEGNAKDLLEEIKKEKAKLIKEGKLKKEKPLPEITEDEIPFDIPENWCWCRIGDIFNLQAGKTISSSEIFTDNSSAKYLCYGGNGVRGYVKNYNREGFFALIGRQGALCGNINFANGQFYATEHAVVVETYCNTDVKWSGLFLQALNLNQYATATAQPGLAVRNINEVLIPLPPLEEQKRIVAVIEKFMPLIEEYGKKEAELTALNADIAKTLKNAILQEAVQGKLLPQIASEDNAKDIKEKKKEKAKLKKEGKIKKEKSLQEITEDEIPFDIPENWCWCRLGDIFEIITGSTPSKTSPEFYGDEIPFYKPADLDFGLGITESSEYLSSLGYEKARKISPNSVLICCIGSIGKTGLIYKEGTCNQQINAILSNSRIEMKYVFYTMNSICMQNQMKEKASMTTLPILNKNNFSECCFPLPPLNEQKRIVAVIEKLLPYNEKIGE